MTATNLKKNSNCKKNKPNLLQDEVPSVPGTGDGEFELDRPGHLDRLVSRHNVISRYIYYSIDIYKFRLSVCLLVCIQ